MSKTTIPITRCQLGDRIVFWRDRKYHLLEQTVDATVVGITYLDDNEQLYLVGTKAPLFDGQWTNEDHQWYRPTTVSRNIEEFRYYWYLQSGQEVELQPQPQEEIGPQKPPLPKGTSQPIISFGDTNSSISLPYTTFTCALCRMEHISFTKDRLNLFTIPSTITTKRSSAVGWYFCCEENCQ